VLELAAPQWLERAVQIFREHGRPLDARRALEELIGSDLLASSTS
jgi:hypothetical protein